MASIRFCDECANLLYPKEDKVNHVLLYACRNCNFVAGTNNPCVFRHDLIVTTKETAGVTQDLETDPTLQGLDSICLPVQPRSTIECPKCHNKDAVFFQDQARRIDTKMVLFYVCTRCHKTFQDPALAARR
ncbi:DNA-directed RNA polymerase II core subunit rpb9 [Microbotryomycetes sp. JL221]|nr:DNA-directed RNA polymerase II core subunit rpb9 [Microbotryomycetes sp. JL221]